MTRQRYVRCFDAHCRPGYTSYAGGENERSSRRHAETLFGPAIPRAEILAVVDPYADPRQGRGRRAGRCARARCPADRDGLARARRDPRRAARLAHRARDSRCRLSRAVRADVVADGEQLRVTVGEVKKADVDEPLTRAGNAPEAGAPEGRVDQANGGVHATSSDRDHYVAKLSAKLRYKLGEAVVTSLPSVTLAISQREDPMPNRDPALGAAIDNAPCGRRARGGARDRPQGPHRRPAQRLRDRGRRPCDVHVRTGDRRG